MGSFSVPTMLGDKQPETLHLGFVLVETCQKDTWNLKGTDVCQWIRTQVTQFRSLRRHYLGIRGVNDLQDIFAVNNHRIVANVMFM